jgi:AbrB family looped-hinge helix DNA binding protein
MIHRATLSSKGQIVIPASVRRELGFEPGLTMRVYSQGKKVILVPEEEDPISAGAGFLKGIIPVDTDKFTGQEESHA